MIRCALKLFAVLLLAGPCVVLPRQASAQENNGQIWVDGIIAHNFAAEYMFETEFSYQALLTPGEGWYSLNFTPTLDRSITPHWDLIIGASLSYTIQNDSDRTAEVRAQLGSRFYFTPFKRMRTRLLVRWEDRFVCDEETMVVENTNRIRARAEVAVPLNAPS